MTQFANINGRITPASEATIPVLDRSFLYGDGVYESLRTYSGVPFLLERHLERLRASAAGLQIPLPSGIPRMAQEVERTLEAAGHAESLVRIVLSRGEGWLPHDPRDAGPPTLVILVTPFTPIPPEAFRDGRTAVLAHVRRNPIACLDPRIKSNNLLNNLLASMEALDRNAPEALLLNIEGDLAEAANANVFVVLENTLTTPSVESGILPGITRDLVLELARAQDIPCREERIPGERLSAARELFLTSTSRAVLPLVQLDGTPVGDGAPGPITRQMQQAYREFVTAGVPRPE